MDRQVNDPINLYPEAEPLDDIILAMKRAVVQVKGTRAMRSVHCATGITLMMLKLNSGSDQKFWLEKLAPAREHVKECAHCQSRLDLLEAYGISFMLAEPISHIATALVIAWYPDDLLEINPGWRTMLLR